MNQPAYHHNDGADDIDLSYHFHTTILRSVIRSAAPTVFSSRMVAHTKYSDAGPGASVAGKKMVSMVPGIKLESR